MQPDRSAGPWAGHGVQGAREGPDEPLHPLWDGPPGVQLPGEGLLLLLRGHLARQQEPDQPLGRRRHGAAGTTAQTPICGAIGEIGPGRKELGFCILAKECTDPAVKKKHSNIATSAPATDRGFPCPRIPIQLKICGEIVGGLNSVKKRMRLFRTGFRVVALFFNEKKIFWGYPKPCKKGAV